MKYLYLPIALVFCISAVAQNVPFTSSNLPIIVIKTNGGTIVDDPKIMVDFGIIDNGPGKRNNLTDPFNAFNGKAGIEIRGSSSQMFPKKQYGIELADAKGDEVEASIFGMPKEADWILFAPYNDKSLIRDALAYRLGRSMGNYASRTKYFELVLNDQYMGVYIFFEKIKRGKNRLAIDKLEKTEVAGDEVTGGYILKIDKTTGGDEGGYVSSYPPGGKTSEAPQKIYFQWEYPKAADLVAAQKTYIQNYIKQFEETLIGENFQDPVNGWTKYADMNSFVDYFIMNELTKNPDGYRLSTFLHKKKDSEGGKIHMGPIWDFNLGFGNVDYCTKGTTTGLVIDFNTICPTDNWQIPFWWKRLWSDATFRTKLSDRWKTLREGSFATNKVLAYVDSVSTVMNVEAQQRNFQRWPTLGQYVWPNYVVLPTYDAEVSWLKTWIEARMTYLDATLSYSIAGVNETAGTINFTAWPNPFDDQLLFEYEIEEPGTTKIEVLDLFGREVISFSDNHDEAGRYSTSNNLNVTAGVYIYRVSHNGSQPLVGKIMRK
jgi:CotH kinase protein